MRLIFVPVILVCAMATSAFAADKDKADEVTRGKQLYFATGCDQCHGTLGKGGAGPRLAPGPIPLAGVIQQLRKPRIRMPLYSAVVMPDSDVAAIYAYLQSIPKAKAAAEIPMLKSLTY